MLLGRTYVDPRCSIRLEFLLDLGRGFKSGGKALKGLRALALASRTQEQCDLTQPGSHAPEFRRLAHVLRT